MKKRWIFVMGVGLLMVLTGAVAETITDEVEGDGGWILAGGSGTFGTAEGIPPTAGVEYFRFSINPGNTDPYNNRAAVKNHGITLLAGYTYTIKADLNVGLNNRPFIGEPFFTPVSDRVAIGFFDPSEIDIHLNNNVERRKIRDEINAVLLDAHTAGLLTWASRAIPPDGGAEWKRWEYTFTVPQGSSFAGKAVWFGVYGGHTAQDTLQSSLAFDNLQLIIQEPQTRTLRIRSIQ